MGKIRCFDRLSVYFVQHLGEKKGNPFSGEDIVHVATAFTAKKDLHTLREWVNVMFDNMNDDKHMPEVEFKKLS